MKKIHHFLKKPEGKFIASLTAIIVLLFAYYFYAMKDYKPTPVEEIVISETDHVRGALDGKVTLVEFGDFQCPACGAYEPMVRKVLADNSKNLKFVFRHFPLTAIHQNSLISAKASEAAGLQGKFWEMHDMIYDNQKDWSSALNVRDIFLTYATTIGLDTKKFSTDLNNKSVEDKILAEYKEGTKLGVQGTPTFFINGKMIQNPPSAEAFNQLIKDATK